MKGMRKRTFWTDVGKFNTSRCDKLQSHVHIFGFLDSHARILVISAKGDTAYPTTMISLWCLDRNSMATIPIISWISQRKTIKMRSVKDWLLTISWIRRTPSERSLTRLDIGGMSLASSLVFNLSKEVSRLLCGDPHPSYLPFAECTLLGISRPGFWGIHVQVILLY